MSSAFKKFFEKKRSDLTFKKAGPGRKLTDTTSHENASTSRSTLPPHSSSTEHPKTTGQQRTAAQSQAALAALNRSAAGKEDTKMSEREKYKAKIRLEAKRQLEKEDREQQQLKQSAGGGRCEQVDKRLSTECDIGEKNADVSSSNEYDWVRYKCDLVSGGGEGGFTLSEIKSLISAFLYEQLQDPDWKGHSSCLMINTLNRDKQKVENCTKLLSRYIDNLLNNSDDEKYKSIRIENKAFKERVAIVEGHHPFMESIGFVKTTIDGEDYWKMNEIDLDLLVTMKSLLMSGESIEPEVDRNVEVIHPGQNVPKSDPLIFENDPKFFEITRSEVGDEQRLRTEKMEKSKLLRTQQMRDRDRIVTVKVPPKFILLRIKFPDGFIVQATFEANETVDVIYRFVSDEILNESLQPFPYTLKDGGENLNNRNATLLQSNFTKFTQLIYTSNEIPTNNTNFLKSSLIT